jgi:hypothetical protein
MDIPSNQVRDVFQYSDISLIQITDDFNLVIKFTSGKEAQFLRVDYLDQVLEAFHRKSGLKLNVIDYRKTKS